MESSFGTFNSNITLHSKNKAEKAHVLPGQNFNFTPFVMFTETSWCDLRHISKLYSYLPRTSLLSSYPEPASHPRQITVIVFHPEGRDYLVVQNQTYSLPIVCYRMRKDRAAIPHQAESSTCMCGRLLSEQKRQRGHISHYSLCPVTNLLTVATHTCFSIGPH